MRRSTSILAYTADFGQHAEIALQGAPNRGYTLRLLMENEKLELQTQDNQTWTPAQRLYVPCSLTTIISDGTCMCRGVSPISDVRVLIQMNNPLIWAKKRLASEPIDVQALYNEYWGSTKHEFSVPSKSSSPNSLLISDHEAQRTSLSLETIIGIFGPWNYISLRALPFVSLQLPIRPN